MVASDVNIVWASSRGKREEAQRISAQEANKMVARNGKSMMKFSKVANFETIVGIWAYVTVS